MQRVALGPGQVPDVAVDESGTAYIAWIGNEAQNATLQYCRLPLGATTCDVRSSLPVPGEGITRPFVMVDGLVVRVMQYRFGLASGGLTPDGHASVFLFTSVDGGATFNQGAQVGTVPFSEAVAGPGGGISLVTDAVTEGELYQRVPYEEAAPATTSANLSTDHLYDGAVAVPTASTVVVVFTDASGNAQYRAYTGVGDPNNAASWTPAVDVGYASVPHLAAGPSGLFMLATRASGKLEVRQFGGGTFGAGVAIPHGTGETPQDHLAQDQGGLLHVLLPQITARCCPLLYAYSGNGQGWTTSRYPLPELAAGARGAFQESHRGTAVWYSGVSTDAQVFAMRIGPKVKLKLPRKRNPPVDIRTPGQRIVVEIDGKLKPPSGVPPADVCGGKLVSTLKRGRSKKLDSRRMKVSAACKFQSEISIPKAKVDSAQTLRLTLKLKGNPAAKRSKRTYKLPLP